MKKSEQTKEAEMRPSYTRADFGKLTRGKFYNQVTANSNVVVLNPEIAKAFPNSNAVNEALGQLLTLAKSATRLTSRSTRVPPKATRAG